MPSVLSACLVLATLGGCFANTAVPWVAVHTEDIKVEAGKPAATPGYTMFTPRLCSPDLETIVTCTTNGILHGVASTFTADGTTTSFPCGAVVQATLTKTGDSYSSSPFTLPCEVPNDKLVPADTPATGCVSTIMACVDTNIDGLLDFPRYSYAIEQYAMTGTDGPETLYAVNAGQAFDIGGVSCTVEADKAEGFYLAYANSEDSVTINCGDGYGAKTTDVKMDGDYQKLATVGVETVRIKAYNVDGTYSLRDMLVSSGIPVRASQGPIPEPTTAAPKGSAASAVASAAAVVGAVAAKTMLGV